MGGVFGDIDIYNQDCQNAIVQVEGLRVSPLTAPTASDDRPMFGEVVWDMASPDCEAVFDQWVPTAEEIYASKVFERTCLYYLQTLLKQVSEEERKRCDWHQVKVLEWASHVVSLTASGQHPTCEKSWLHDTQDYIDRQLNR